ncbi:MAG: flippase [Bacteroidales bacterium]|nr:flippase [Bacteroidales bacterium]
MTSLKKNFIYNLLLLGSNLLFPVINFAYASRIVGPEGIGKIQFVITFATYFVLIAQLGIPAYGMREVAKAKNDQKRLDRIFSELLVINMISSLVLLIIYLAVIISVYWFRASLNYYLLAGLLVISGFSVLEWFYKGTENFRFLSLRSVVVKMLALIGLILFVRSPGDLMIYFLITMGSVLAVNILNLIGLKGRVTLYFRGLRLKRHLNALLILFASSLTIGVYTLGDTLLLGFLTDNQAVGFYTAAKKLILITIPLITALGTVLIPKMAQSLDVMNQKELQMQVDRSFAFISLFGVPVSLGLLVFAPEIMPVFSGTQFEGAVLTLQVIGPTVFVVALGHLFGLQLLIPGGFERLYLKSTILGMIASLILNVVLISNFRDKGAAATLLITEILVTFTAGFMVWKKMELHFNWYLTLKALLASLVFIPVALALRSLHLPLFTGLLAAVAVSTILYFMVQLFVFREPLMKQVVREVGNKFKI